MQYTYVFVKGFFKSIIYLIWTISALYIWEVECNEYLFYYDGKKKHANGKFLNQQILRYYVHEYMNV